MNIVLVLEQLIHAGGGFQQSLSTLLLCQRYGNATDTFTVLTTKKRNLATLKQYGVQHVVYFPKNFYPKGWIRQRQFNRCLTRLNTDLVYFLSPSNLAMRLAHNYIYTLWDLCHIDQPEFPEMRLNGQFEMREALYRHVLPKATMVTVDAEATKQKLVNAYNVAAERVAVLPFLPSEAVLKPQAPVDIKQHYGVAGDYIFYPAHFSAHKNHIYILQALAALKQQGITLHAIFSGQGGNAESVVKRQIQQLNLAEQVHCIGFAPEVHLSALYQQSLALVMPTYFGPTNIPPMEAFHLGVPVFYSDLPGLRDQVDGAAVLMDLNNPAQLAQQLKALISGEWDAKATCDQGQKLVAQWSQAQYWQVLNQVFRQYQIKRQCWYEG